MFTIRPDLRSATNQDGATILDALKGQMITLNPTGAYVWDKLSRGMSVEETIVALAIETNTDEQLVADDVRSFLTELATKGLLDN